MSRPSNGTMMDMWLDRWCFRCINDHPASHGADDYENGCEILAHLYMADHDENIPEMVGHDYEWRDGWSPDHYECRMFERCPCRDEPGWEPPVAPTPDPNQGLLFEVVDETPATPMLIIPVNEPESEVAT